MPFMGFLRQSTTGTMKLGPFVDTTDGNTEETGLTIAQADVRVSKNGSDFAQKSDTSSCTHDELGIYDCIYNTTDTNTIGRLDVAVHEADALHVVQTYYILEEDIYDALFASSADGFDSDGRVDVGTWLGNAVTVTSSLPNVNIGGINGDLTAPGFLEADYDGTGYNKANSTIGTVTNLAASAIASGVITLLAQQSLADTILSRGVENVENTADIHSLTKVVLASTEWTASGTGLTIRKTDGSEFLVKSITTDAGANLIVTVE